MIRNLKPQIDGCTTAHTRSNIGSHELTALYTFSRGAFLKSPCVRPSSIGACPTVAGRSASSRHLSPRCHSPLMIHLIWIVSLSSLLCIHLELLPDSEMFTEAEYVSLKGLKSRSPEEETRWQTVRQERRKLQQAEAMRIKRAASTEKEKDAERARVRE